MTTFRIVTSIALLTMILLGPRPSAAANHDDFQAHVDDGLALYDQARYDEAGREFRAAYQIRRLPRLLYLLGQSYRKQGEARQAQQAFKDYLREDPKASAEIRQKVSGYIAELDRSLALAGARPAQRAQPVGDRRRAVRIARWVLLGVGLGAAAAGAALWAVDGQPACSLAGGQTQCPENLRTLPLGAALVAGGAAALATSGILFGLGGRF